MHLVTTLHNAIKMKDLITNYWNKARGKGPIQRYWEEQAPAEDDAKLCDLKYKCAEGHTQDHDWVFHRVFHSIYLLWKTIKC